MYTNFNFVSFLGSDKWDIYYGLIIPPMTMILVSAKHYNLLSTEAVSKETDSW